MKPFTSTKLLEQIDQAIIRADVDRPRPYLGMSGIGSPCLRKIWLQWRWAKFETFSPRIKRLFNRGHLEEFRFTHYLRQAGYEVQDVDPNTQQQFELIAQDGHVMGHCDGIVKLPITKEPEWCIDEMKTHGEKSFNALKRAASVKVAKYDHYCKMQRYMHAMGLGHALYMAVNKNTDALYLEIVSLDPRAIMYLLEIEADLVWRYTAPDRISEDGDYWVCRFCTFQGICHYEEKVNRTCRMCYHARPVKEGKWICQKKDDQILPYQQQMKGCKKSFQVL